MKNYMMRSGTQAELERGNYGPKQCQAAYSNSVQSGQR